MKDELLECIKMVAPGTILREGLENILKAKTGGLIVLGDTPEVMKLVDGGFNINADFTPARLYELAKMDGAIILSQDGKKILYANAQLNPDPSIPVTETGMRHRTAERVAKQTNQVVIAISERRNVITLYKGDIKYALKETNVILTKANQAIQTLEKYKAVLDQAMNNLSILEFDDLVTLYDVIVVIQRTEMVLKIVAEIERYIYELGTEGYLVKMQLEELVSDVDEDGMLVIMDYCVVPENKTIKETTKNILRHIKALSREELMDFVTISKLLGYTGGINTLDLLVTPRGYRILNKIPRLPLSIIENIVERFKNLRAVLKASIEELDEVEGIGEVRAKSIKEGLRRLEEQILLDRHIFR